MGFFDKISGKAKKREEFYASYAESHGLARSQQQIPPVTENINGEVETVERFDGPLVEGLEGTIAMIETTIRTSVQVVTTDRDAAVNDWLPEGTITTGVDNNVDRYPGTVIMVPLGGLAGTLEGLAVKGNYRKQSTGDRETYGDLRRISTEGTGLEEHFYVFADEGADPKRVRGIFSPAFSTWLNARDFRFFSFEFGQGTLVLKHPQYAKNAEQLDAYVAEASEIARALQATATD